MKSSRRAGDCGACWRALPLVFCTALTALATNPPTNWRTRMNESCGPQALAAAFYLLGRQVELSQCAAFAATDPNGITTMSGLQKAARSLGASACAMRLKPAELAMLDHVAILHVALPDALDHYLVFKSHGNGLFELLNPTKARLAQHHTPEQLGLMWDGSCLVFTETPRADLLRVGVSRATPAFIVCAAVGLGLAAACFFWPRTLRVQARNVGAERRRVPLLPGSWGMVAIASIALVVSPAVPGLRTISAKRHARLLLGSDVLELGDIPRVRSAEADIWVANVGRKDLHIRESAIKPSCACVKAKVRRATLPGGAKEPLRIYVGPKAELGPFRHSVYIPCDEPTGGKVLTVKGRVVGPGVVYPPRLYFGVSADGGQEATKTFFYVGRYTDTAVTAVTSDSPHVRCRLVRQNAGYAEFEASVSGWPTMGRLEGTITITTTDSGRAEVQVPFSGTVPRLTRAG